jgi:hypothetical protein
MCARFLGIISRSSPIRALPVALIRFSPLDVKGSSVVPVCRPLRDHSVSPWRITKTRGVVMAVYYNWIINYLISSLPDLQLQPRELMLVANGEVCTFVPLQVRCGTSGSDKRKGRTVTNVNTGTSGLKGSNCRIYCTSSFSLDVIITSELFDLRGKEEEREEYGRNPHCCNPLIPQTESSYVRQRLHHTRTVSSIIRLLYIFEFFVLFNRYRAPAVELHFHKKAKQRTKRGSENERGVETAERGCGLEGILELIVAEAEFDCRDMNPVLNDLLFFWRHNGTCAQGMRMKSCSSARGIIELR